MRMLAVSLAGKKSRRWFAGVVEKVRREGRAGLLKVVVVSRRPIVEEEQEEFCRRGATARESCAAFLGEQSLVVVRGANMGNMC